LKHQASASFWRLHSQLNKAIRTKANKQFALLEDNASHPSLQLKPVGRYWSARVDENYRVLAVKDGDYFIWFWIGAHKEYERLIK
jgi:hypothetical protein